MALTVPDLAAAEAFYTRTWQLDVAARGDGVLYLRGSGADHHLLALHAGGGTPQIRQVTLRARSADALAAIAQATRGAPAARVERAPAPADDPAGGRSLVIRDADGRRFEVVHGDARRAPTRRAPPDQPQRLAHAVLNSHDVAATQAFFEQALGFVLADRTRIMAFMNCNADHHSIALGDTDNDALNHIAFLMPDARRGDARRRPHEGRRPRHRMGPRPPRPGRQRLQLLHRPVRHRHRVHRRGRADRRQLPRARPRRLDLAARPRRPMGHLGPAQRARSRRRSAPCSSRPGADLTPNAARTAMRFTTFLHDGQPRLAVVDGDAGHRPRRRPAGRAGRPACRAEGRRRSAGRRRAALASAAPRLPLAGLSLAPLVPEPGKTICLGLNYFDHAKEGGRDKPDYPWFFFRGKSSLMGHGQPGLVPKVSTKFDYEAELAVVIGKRGAAPRGAGRRAAVRVRLQLLQRHVGARLPEAHAAVDHRQELRRHRRLRPGAGDRRRTAAGCHRACASRAA